MSNTIGYLKYSLTEPDIQPQIDQLEAAGVSKIYRETPAKTKNSASQLDALLEEAQEGDTLVVTSLNRIAHDTRHLLEIIKTLRASGVMFKVLDSGIDTSTSHGEAMCLLLGAIVDFERNIVRDRQAQGIARAKKEGRYKGRKPTARAKTDEVMALNGQGLTRQKIADELGIGVASVYRILKANTEAKKPRSKIAKKPEKPVGKQKRAERKPKHEADAEQLSFF